MAERPAGRPASPLLAWISRYALPIVLVIGLVARLDVALALEPGRGFSGDMNDFVDWARLVVEHGPFGFYAHADGANYPPLSILLLGLLRLVAQVFAPALNMPVGELVAVLLKVPTAVADVVSGWLVFRLVRPVSGRRTALVCTVMFLLLPAVWYDSLLWGQFDSLLLVLSLGALTLLVEGRGLAAGLMAVAAVLTKPQGVIVLLVVGVVLVVRHLRRDEAGIRRWRRLLVIAAAMVVFAVLVLMLFTLRAVATGPLHGVPVLGDLLGFLQQNIGSAAAFPALTANAANLWALVGSPSLAASIGSGTAVWHADSLAVFGVAASTIGLVLLALSIVAVLGGLILRSDRVAVLLGFAVLQTAFFAFPTRVHERYLVPVFGVLAVLAAGVLWRWIAVWVLAVVNTLNLNAVLAGIPRTLTEAAGSGAPAVGGGRLGGVLGSAALPPASPSGPTGQAAIPAPGTAPDGGATAISLPGGEFARQEWVFTLCALVQSLAGFALLACWIVFVVRSVRGGAESVGAELS